MDVEFFPFDEQIADHRQSVTSSFLVYSPVGDVNDVTDDVDEQYCKMKFGSWTFSGRQVTLDWYEDYRQVVQFQSAYLLIYLPTQGIFD